MNKFEERIYNFLKFKTTWEVNNKILVSVSGGPDSVLLAVILNKLNIPINLAYFDHQTRDGESEKDGIFVKELADRMGVTFFHVSEPISENALINKKSFEEYARERRYEFLYNVAKDNNINYIATGHHMDDQAETVLFRLLRGSSCKGLSGIPPERSFKDIKIIRPLLDIKRKEIIEYLEVIKQEYKTDYTNYSMKYSRNKIRYNLIPYIEKEYSHGIKESLAHLAYVQHDENDWINKCTIDHLNKCILNGHDNCIIKSIFNEYHPAMARRVLFMWFDRYNIKCVGRRIIDIIDKIKMANKSITIDLDKKYVLKIHLDLIEIKIRNN